jgi:hypothetical protein
LLGLELLPQSVTQFVAQAPPPRRCYNGVGILRLGKQSAMEKRNARNAPVSRRRISALRAELIAIVPGDHDPP